MAHYHTGASRGSNRKHYVVLHSGWIFEGGPNPATSNLFFDTESEFQAASPYQEYFENETCFREGDAPNSKWLEIIQTKDVRCYMMVITPEDWPAGAQLIQVEKWALKNFIEKYRPNEWDFKNLSEDESELHLVPANWVDPQPAMYLHPSITHAGSRQ